MEIDVLPLKMQHLAEAHPSKQQEANSRNGVWRDERDAIFCFRQMFRAGLRFVNAPRQSARFRKPEGSA